tara:strand:- start:220 stop:381 length:162 start_codon:yes stop_codon:yes gene_type:complete
MVWVWSRTWQSALLKTHDQLSRGMSAPAGSVDHRFVVVLNVAVTYFNLAVRGL